MKINTSWEDYCHMWTVSFKLWMPPVESRMFRIEGHWCLQYCQLADKGWPCLINLAHHGNFGWWRYSLFCHLLSHWMTSQLNEGIWPCVCACMWACVHSCIICKCLVLECMCAQSTAQPTSPQISSHKHSAPIQCTHLLSLIYCLLPHVVLLCVCCVCCKVEGLS